MLLGKQIYLQPENKICWKMDTSATAVVECYCQATLVQELRQLNSRGSLTDFVQS